VTRRGHVVLGRVTAPHGIRGELRVVPTTDFPERLSRLRHALMISGGGAPVRVTVVRARSHKRFVLLKIEGCDSLEAAERFRGCELAVPRSEAAPLPEGSYYVFDIVGLEARTEGGTPLGRVSEVLHTPANDVYVVSDDEGLRGGRELLIPAIREVVVDIDLEGGTLTIRPLPGMLD